MRLTGRLHFPRRPSLLRGGTFRRIALVMAAALVAGPIALTASPALAITNPGLPRNLALAPIGGGVYRISWNPPASDGGSPVTSYRLAYQFMDGSGDTVSTPTATYQDIDDMIPGTQYRISVEARNAHGHGSQTTITPFAAVMASPPTALSLTAGNGALQADWTAPADAGSTGVTGYHLEASANGYPTVTADVSAVSGTLSGLANGVSYTMTVASVNGGGRSTTISATGTPFTNASVPNQLSLTAGNGSILATWSAPDSDGGSAVTSYHVSAIADNQVSVTADVTDPTATLTDLVNNVTYTVAVSAVNAAGEGDHASGDVTPLPLASAPHDLAVVGADGALSVSWNAPTDDGGTPISGYHVVATADELGTVTQDVDGDATSATVTGLTNGVSYTVTVQALNDYGLGAVATALGVPTTIPDAATDLVLTPDDATIVASWTPPANNGGSAVTGYHVEATADDQPTVTADVVDPTVTLSGLTNTVTYTVTVTAQNGAGSSLPVSNTAMPWPLAAAPTDLALVAGDGTLDVSWTAPTDTGLDVPISGYRVIATADGHDTVIDTPQVTSDLLINLTNDVAYTVTVQTLTAAGYGAAATATGTPFVLPLAPSNLVLTPYDGEIDLTWEAPADNGGSPVTGYHVTGTADGHDPIAADLPDTILRLTVDNGVEYHFTVSANVASGTGEAVSGDSTAYTVPGAPSDLQLTPTAESITATWTAPASNGGSAITGYHLTATSDGQTTVTTDVSDPAATTGTLTGLVDGVDYAVTVTAANAGGSSSPVSGTSRPFTVSDPVTGVIAVPANSKLTVVWTTPVSDGGSVISNYHVELTAPGRPTINRNVSVQRSVILNLANHIQYTVTVWAQNAAGDSTPTVVTGTPSSAFSGPSSMNVTSGDQSVTASWSPPSNNGSAAVTSYTVSANAGGHPTVTADVVGTSATLTGLVNGVNYWVVVVANNAAGPGGSFGEYAMPVGLSDAPTALVVTPGYGALTASWTAPENIGGGTFSGYHLAASADGHTTVSADVTETSGTLSGLVPGVPYTVTVSATTDAGAGAEISDTGTAFGAADAPNTLLLTPAAESIAATWNSPENDGGKTITGYHVAASADNHTTVTADVTDPAATITGLIDGVQYTVAVVAVTDAGYGASISDTAIPFTTASAPTSLQLTPAAESITATWTAPSSNGGSAITGYHLAATAANHPTVTLNVTNPTGTLTGLVNGVNYTVTVTTTTQAGAGAGVSAACTPVTSAGPPGELQLTPSDATIVATWTTPADNGGGTVGEFHVEAIASGHSPVIVDVNVPTATLTGLVNGVTYTVSVLGVNVAGFGATVSNTTTPFTVAGAPTALLLTPGNATLGATWTAPDINGGSTVTGYHLAATAADHPTVSLDVTEAHSTLTGLVNGVAYLVTVTATNSAGAGAALAATGTPMSPAPASTVPGAPGLTTVARGSHTVTVNVTAPQNDGHAALTGYRITGGPAVVTVARSGGTVTLTGLLNGTAYTLTASAHNSIGWSTESTAVVATPATVPDAPAVQVTTSWYSARAVVTAPGWNGGTALTGYLLTLRGPTGDKSVLVATAGAVSFSGLAPASVYTFTTYAGNTMGLSRAVVATVRTAALPAPKPVPAAPTTFAPGESATLSGAGLFANGSATLTSQGKAQVLRLSRDLSKARSIRCEGYTDFGGNADANWWLGLARAQSVCQALRSDGVRATQHLVSWGQLKPVTTHAHRELNRRVIVFVEQ
jgi:outer membrane protein OmpA-like peptidoglycan-associated protein